MEREQFTRKSVMSAKSAKSERQIAIDAIYRHMWRSMQKGREPSWFRDTSRSTAVKLLDITLHRLHERRAREEDWRGFLSRPGAWA